MTRGYKAMEPRRSREERLRLFREYELLARKIASAYLRSQPRIDPGDAVGGALLGLWDATATWAEDGGRSFKSHAGQRCWGAIVDRLRDSTGARRRRDSTGGNRTFLPPPLVSLHSNVASRRNECRLEAADNFWHLRRGFVLRDRLLLLLRYAEGLSFADIGAVFGVTESAMYARHRTIVAELRQRLGATQEGTA